MKADYHDGEFKIETNENSKGKFYLYINKLRFRIC